MLFKFLLLHLVFLLYMPVIVRRCKLFWLFLLMSLIILYSIIVFSNLGSFKDIDSTTPVVCTFIFSSIVIFYQYWLFFLRFILFLLFNHWLSVFLCWQLFLARCLRLTFNLNSILFFQYLFKHCSTLYSLDSSFLCLLSEFDWQKFTLLLLFQSFLFTVFFFLFLRCFCLFFEPFILLDRRYRASSKLVPHLTSLFDESFVFFMLLPSLIQW